MADTRWILSCQPASAAHARHCLVFGRFMFDFGALRNRPLELGGNGRQKVGKLDRLSKNFDAGRVYLGNRHPINVVIGRDYLCEHGVQHLPAAGIYSKLRMRLQSRRNT